MSKELTIRNQQDDSVVVYQSKDGIVRLDVQLSDETVWLTQQQMMLLFETTKQNVSLHINNIFREGELDKISVVKDCLTTAADGKNYHVLYYNLDVIISVGYRVKSKRGTQFRQWANKVLKDYLLKGYSINQRLAQIENKIDVQGQKLAEHDQKIDFFVRTSLPPVEGIFFDGQIFDAYTFVSDLIRSAKKSIVLFDNYVDDTVLAMLDKRCEKVSATIYTQKIKQQLSLDIEKHNAQYQPIEVKPFDKVHDRFLCIDSTVYHIGASLKDLGRRWFAFSRLEMKTKDLLGKM
jgi:hypothetical protein